MKIYSLSVIDQAGLVHASAQVGGEAIVEFIIADCLKNLKYGAPALTIQLHCKGEM